MPFDGTIDAARSQLTKVIGSFETIDAKLLRLIEETSSALGQRTQNAILVTTFACATTLLIKSLKPGGILDCNGTLGERLQACAASIAASIADCRASKATIDEDGRLESLENHKAHLHSCFEKLIDAFAFLRQSLIELRDAVIAYDSSVPAAEYPQDDGPLTSRQHKALRAHTPKPKGGMVVVASLLD